MSLSDRETEWLTVAEFAAHFRVTPRTVTRWVNEDPNMRARRIGPAGRTIRIHISELNSEALPAA